MSKLVIVGLGYTGQAFASYARSQGWEVVGTRRKKEEGCIIFDGVTPLHDCLTVVGNAEALLIAIPPDEQGDPFLRLHAEPLCQLTGLQWLGYLSSTGVYGDHGGSWVDETTQPQPISVSGSQRLRAEEQWQELAKRAHLPLHIFRLAGIYGPGRSALDRLRAGEAQRIDKPGHVFSRIHVEDIVHILWRSMTKPTPGEIFNLSDDEPASSADVLSFGAQLLGMAPPPLIPLDEANLAPMARAFYQDNKRVSNNKIKRILGGTLLYPNYRAGLEALNAEQIKQAYCEHKKACVKQVGF